MWIVVFPEGTRFNIERKDMIAKSQKYAADHSNPSQTPIILLFTFLTLKRSCSIGQCFDTQDQGNGSVLRCSLRLR